MIERSLGAPVCDPSHDLAESLTAARRHLHAHPELGFEEHETAAFIERSLAALGLTPVRVAGTGVWADVAGDAPGGSSAPFRCYRADIDALPIQDAKRDVPYASRTPGVAHLCGHDAHTAIGLGVARLLVEARSELRGTVRVFFQPNEEGTPSGAPRMIAAGVLDGPAGETATACLGVHVDPTLDVGRYGLLAGPVTASIDRFDVTVRSTASTHSARPHLAPDAVWLATTLAQHAYTLAGRVTDARRPTVFSIGRFEAGQAYNVIPAVVRFGGTLRSVDTEARETFERTLTAFASGLDATYGTDIEVAFTYGSPPVVNDAALVDVAARTIVETRGEAARHVFDLPSMGAEDFAFYTERVPGLFVRVGTRSSTRTAYAVHDSRFDLDESALEPAARLMADLLVRIGNG